MDWITLKAKGLETSFGRRDDAQISHGLNLVLKLKNPADMPVLLAKVRQSQRKINAGLGELNFVHFARFLPTHDNSALQVITEFDGPLAPYVLDFVIEIGDVFDMLLGFTEGTGHLLPTAKHPAEFLAFVEKNNTVTVPPGPGVADWPLYAAYPEATALDILGPRRDLPLPKADRWATAVEREDVQGNILRGYRAERVRHYVLKVVDAQQARAWLADKATPEGKDTATQPAVTSFQSWGPQRPTLMLNIGLTFAGMQALGIHDAWLAPFPDAFRQGALERAAGNFDTGSNAPEHWWLGGPQQAPDIHVLASLYQGPGGQADFVAADGSLLASLSAAGLELLAVHDAHDRGRTSWFGYTDGIASPRIATEAPNAEQREDLQPAATAGEFVLGATYRNIYGGDSLGNLPEPLAANGSFCAVRVLAQDTRLFADTLEREANRLNVDADWLAAKLMGRWYEGAPVSLYPDQRPSAPAENERNDFDYAPSYEYPDTPMDHAGRACPVGAHVRRSNPRSARVAGARYTRRLMRRGMHYAITDPQGQPEVGLFGMFICADLERQFEFIQRQWINGDSFASGLRGTRDPITGTVEGGTHAFTIPRPGGDLQVHLPQFVHTRGSLYLFMPGLKALRAMERFAPELPPAADTGRSAPEYSLLPSADMLKEISSELDEDRLMQIALAGAAPEALAADGGGGMAAAPSLRNLRFDPRQRSFQANPYPVFARFRRSERVHYSPLYQGWFVFGYPGVVEVCTNDAVFSAAQIGSTEPRGLFTMDPPEHSQVRALVAAAWNSAAANAAALVDASIAKALAAIGTRPCFDLVDDFARPVPRDVYFDIVGGQGIPPAERLILDALARTVMKHHDRTLDPLQRWDEWEASKHLGARLGLLLKNAPNTESLKGTFIAELAKSIGAQLSFEVAVRTLVNLTVAGYMSVEFLLATGIRRLLLEERTHWEALQQAPGHMDLFLREMRRTEHALAVVERFARKETHIDGTRIPQSGLVLGVLASANRDETIFGLDADQFNPHREWPGQHHLALGWGTHECMGRVLEGHISGPAIRELMKAMPALHLQSAAQPPWFENFYFRSFDHLRVIVN